MSYLRIIMTGVREHGEGYDVELRDQFTSTRGEPRLCVLARNEGGYNSTAVDLLDLIQWLRENKPELLNPPMTHDEWIDKVVDP